MAIQRKLVNPALIIDNLVVAYVPNSIRYTEGFGEQQFRTQTGGGGTVQQIIIDDLSKKRSMVKFKIEGTVQNIEFFRAIKANQDGHVITISDTDFTRTMTGAILVSDYEVDLSNEGEIELEFVGNSMR